MEEPQEPTTAPGHPQTATENPMNGSFLHDAILPTERAHLTPERLVCAKGVGAYGKFTVTNDVSRYTRAGLFNEVGKETKVFLRFSTMGGEKGSADTGRDPRGFSVKFYTEDGNWDLVGSNTPVFSMRDPQKFGNFLRSQQRDPHTHIKSPTMMWDYWSLNPESLHQVMMLMSDRGTPFGYRHMNGYGSHTFSLINAHGERFWVKFHVKSAQGIKNVTDAETAGMASGDPNFSQRDLMQAIEKGDFPRWHLKIQVMPEAEASTYKHNPFDLTKVWPHADYPLIDVGTLELNENPDPYFAHVEQAAFTPAQLVDGIGLSPDRMLQGRILSYSDAQRYRLGSNYEQIPVNRCPYEVTNFRSDGDWEASPTDGHDRNDQDHYSQPGDLYREVMTVDERKRLIRNIVSAMNGIGGPERDLIINRQFCHWFRCDITLGMAIAQGLGLGMDAMREAMTSEHTRS
ncbi:MAG: catalase [Bacteroidetes bacterium]|nr:catalase [Fibrella sp.]